MNISDIQHFSVGDGDGIRTTVFFKGCNMHCPWCHNPETLSPAPVRLFMKGIDKNVTFGREMSCDEIIRDVMADERFYRASGGGVTLSGGEVMLQAKEAAELAEKLKALNINVIVDTAGNVPYEEFERMNPYTDVYFFDIKASDSEKYSILGGDFNVVCKNIRALLRDGKEVRARIPLIPGFNDGEYTAKMCALISSLGIKNADLLPFHRLGSGKYEAMGREYLYKNIEPQSPEEIEKTACEYRKVCNIRIER
ncbi:MAG: radical SAM protein [Eubacteriales bacterium]